MRRLAIALAIIAIASATWPWWGTYVPLWQVSVKSLSADEQLTDYVRAYRQAVYQLTFLDFPKDPMASPVLIRFEIIDRAYAGVPSYWPFGKAPKPLRFEPELDPTRALKLLRCGQATFHIRLVRGGEQAQQRAITRRCIIMRRIDAQGRILMENYLNRAYARPPYIEAIR